MLLVACRVREHVIMCFIRVILHLALCQLVGMDRSYSSRRCTWLIPIRSHCPENRMTFLLRNASLAIRYLQVRTIPTSSECVTV